MIMKIWYCLHFKFDTRELTDIQQILQFTKSGTEDETCLYITEGFDSLLYMFNVLIKNMGYKTKKFGVYNMVLKVKEILEKSAHKEERKYEEKLRKREKVWQALQQSSKRPWDKYKIEENMEIF